MHYNKGFSLVELLVIAAIIAILAGIALPTYQKNTTKARTAELVGVLEGLSRQVITSYNAKGKMPDTLENISGVGLEGNGDYGNYVLDDLTTHLHYDSGSTWTNIGAMIQLSIDSKIGKAIPGFTQSTDGADGAKNSISLGLYEKDGTIIVYCGVWDSSSNKYIPLDYLPTGCNSDNFNLIVTGN